MAERSKKREAKLCVKNQNLKYFDAKLRFALLASLRAFSFASLSHFERNSYGRLIGHFPVWLTVFSSLISAQIFGAD